MEPIVYSLGLAVAKIVAKAWFKSEYLAGTTGLDLRRLVEGRVPDIFARNATERELQRMAETVARRVRSFVEAEFAQIPDNEVQAAVSAVVQTFEDEPLTPALILGEDLNPVALERHYLAAGASVAENALLSSDGEHLYRRLVAESCAYVVEIASALPSFEFALHREILQRETEIAGLVQLALERLPEASADTSGRDDDADFELRYLREVNRRLDQLELFGVDVHERSRRYSLSLAYITLATTGPERASTETNGRSRKEDDQASAFGDITDVSDDAEEISISEALSGSERSLVRGEAGSGKTTLLQWLAVTAAQGAFSGTLESWNGSVPFFIQLRRYVGEDLPEPSNYIEYVARMLRELMPPGWVTRVLDDGRGLILVDGIDELPEEQREAVREWLQETVAAFPRSRVVITSRPPAVDEGWLDAEAFADHELLPMTLADIDAFIDHWHAAATPSTDDSNELGELALTLKGIIRSSPSIQSLATSPLLLAMLCALNRDRRSQIPRDRMELYRIALEMLIDRRDTERKIPTGDLVLRLSEKFALLEELAFWLLLNQQSDIVVDAAKDRITTKLKSMPQITADADAVFEYLLLRSGVLREPVEGRVDFLHRTFQEYLGAHEAVEQHDIGLLVERGHLDQWREVVVLAAGHATPAQRAELINGLLDRGDVEAQFRHRLHLLAVACLETSIDLQPEVRVRVQKSLEQLVPPRSMSEARALASARELAVPLLGDQGHAYATEVAASVRTLSYIGGDAALDALAEIARAERNRVTVARELIRAWPAFDKEQYAERVLSASCLNYGTLPLRDPAFLTGVRHLTRLKRLQCSFSHRHVELSELAGLTALESLRLERCSGCESFVELQDVPNLKALHVVASGLSEVESLSHLHSLETLGLHDHPGIREFLPLGELLALRSLSLSGPGALRDLTEIGYLGNDLMSLSLADFEELENLSGISGLSALQALRASYCKELNDISELTAFADLVILQLYGSDGGWDVQDLAPLNALSHLDLEACGIRDISSLAEHHELRHLDLAGNRDLVDIGPLGQLSGLEWLDLRGTAVTDFSPILGMSGAQVHLPFSARSELPREFLGGNTVRWGRYWWDSLV